MKQVSDLINNFGDVLKQFVVTSVRVWIKNDVAFRSAGLTYYAMFAMIPLLSLLITISSIVITQEFLASELNGYIATVFNDPVATRLQEFVANLVGSDYSVALSIGGLVIFMYATTTYFARLNQNCAEIVTNHRPDNPLLYNLRERLRSLVYAIFIFFFIVITSAAQTLVDNLGVLFPIIDDWNNLGLVVELFGVVISLLVFAGLISAYYRSVLGKIASKSSFLVTSLLVSLAVYLINIFLSYMLSFSATYYDYGVFSATLSVVFWMFLINTVLLCGAGIIPTELMRRLNQ